MIRLKASTTSGSNCFPAFLRISSRASQGGIPFEGRYKNHDPEAKILVMQEGQRAKKQCCANTSGKFMIHFRGVVTWIEYSGVNLQSTSSH
jgi:hypothetical protein